MTISNKDLGTNNLPTLIPDKKKTPIVTPEQKLSGTAAYVPPVAPDVYGLDQTGVDALNRSFTDRLKLKQQDTIEKITPEQRYALDQDEIAGNISMQNQGLAKNEYRTLQAMNPDKDLGRIDLTNTSTSPDLVTFDPNPTAPEKMGIGSLGSIADIYKPQITPIPYNPSTPEVGTSTVPVAPVTQVKGDFNTPVTTGMDLKNKLNAYRKANGLAEVDYETTPVVKSQQTTTETPSVASGPTREEMLKMYSSTSPNMALPEEQQKMLSELQKNSQIPIQQSVIDEVSAFYNSYEMKNAAAQVQQQADLRKQAENDIAQSNVATQIQTDDLLRYEKAQKDFKDLQLQEIKNQAVRDQANAESSMKADLEIENLLASISGQRYGGGRNIISRVQAYNAQSDKITKDLVSKVALSDAEKLVIHTQTMKEVGTIREQGRLRNVGIVNDLFRNINISNQTFGDKSEKAFQNKQALTQTASKMISDENNNIFEKSMKVRSDWAKQANDENQRKLDNISDYENRALKVDLAAAKTEAGILKNSTFELKEAEQLKDIATFQSDPSLVTGTLKAKAEAIFTKAVNSIVVKDKSNGTGVYGDDSTVTLTKPDGTTEEMPIKEFSISQKLKNTILTTGPGKIALDTMGKGSMSKPGTKLGKTALELLAMKWAGLGPKMLDPSWAKTTAGASDWADLNNLLMQAKLNLKDSTYGLGALSEGDNAALDAAIGLTDPTRENFAKQAVAGVDMSGLHSTILGSILRLYRQIDSKENDVLSVVKSTHQNLIYANGLREQFLNTGKTPEQVKNEINEVITTQYTPDLASKAMNALTVGGEVADGAGKIAGSVKQFLTSFSKADPSNETISQVYYHGVGETSAAAKGKPLSQPGTGGAAN